MAIFRFREVEVHGEVDLAETEKVHVAECHAVRFHVTDGKDVMGGSRRYSIRTTT
jgi:hypothetical protein